MTFSRRDFLGAIGIASAGGVTSLYGQAPSADLVLYNGKIVTVDDAFSIREAIAIKDGRIVAVGANDLRNRYAAARSIDLRGRTVIPGFHDTHIHLGGHSRRYIDLNDTTSLVQLKEQVTEKAKELGPGEWITGGGWDEYHFKEQKKPLRGDLDAAAVDGSWVLFMRRRQPDYQGYLERMQMLYRDESVPVPTTLQAADARVRPVRATHAFCAALTFRSVSTVPLRLIRSIQGTPRRKMSVRTISLSVHRFMWVARTSRAPTLSP